MPQVQGPALSAWLSADLWPVGCCAGVSTAVTSVLACCVSPELFSQNLQQHSMRLQRQFFVPCALNTSKNFGNWRKRQGEKSRRGTFLLSASQHFWLCEQQYPVPLSISKVVAQCGLLKLLHILNLFLISLPMAPHPLSSKSKFKANDFKPKALFFTNSSRLLDSNRNKALLTCLMSALSVGAFLCALKIWITRENLLYFCYKTIPSSSGVPSSSDKEVSCKVFCIVKVRSRHKRWELSLSWRHLRDESFLKTLSSSVT